MIFNRNGFEFGGPSSSSSLVSSSVLSQDAKSYIATSGQAIIMCATLLTIIDCIFVLEDARTVALNECLVIQILD